MTYHRLLPMLAMLLLCAPLSAAAAGADTANAAEMGRLFTSPQTRAELDRLRRQGGRDDGNVDQVTLDGFVRSSSGSTTAWVNQQAQHGVVVNPGKGVPKVALRLPSGEQLQLKAGQSADLKQGTVHDQLDNSAAQARAPEAR
jgi:hypothetical protein